MTTQTFVPSFPLPDRSQRAFRAARGDRVAARFIDNLIQMVPAFAVFLVVAELLDQELGLYVGISASTLTFLGVWAVNMQRLVRTGQTFGKKAMSIELVHSDGARVDFVRGVLVREVFFAISSAIPGLGSVISLFDGAVILLPDRRCLHDYLCSTEVVSLKNLDERVNSYAMADVFR